MDPSIDVTYEDVLTDVGFMSSTPAYAQIQVVASSSFKQSMDIFSNGATKFLNKDVWLAGGSILDHLQKAPIKDFDIFGTNKEDLLKFCDNLKSIGFTQTHSSSEVNSFKRGETSVQVVLREGRLSAGPNSCIQLFPFHLNQFAYDGWFIYTTHEALANMHNKLVTPNNIEPVNALESIRRLNRYGQKGYTASSESIIKIADALRCMNMDEYHEQVMYVSITGQGGY